MAVVNFEGKRVARRARRKGSFIDTTRSRTLRCASHIQNGDRLFGDCDATAAAHEPWTKKRQLSFVECQGLQSASSSIATMPVSEVVPSCSMVVVEVPASWSAPSAAPEDDGPPTKKETHVFRRGNGLGDGTTPYRSRRCARDAERV